LILHYILDARTATPHFPGIGRYVANLAAGLIPLLAADERLTILYDPAHPPAPGPSKAVRLVPTPVSPFSLRQQWAIPRLIRELVPMPGVLGSTRHASALYHSPYYLMPYRPGAATVLTVYDLIPLLFPEHSTLRARLLFRWTAALALRTARLAIAISESTRADFLARFRLAPERIVAIPLAADPIFRPPTAEAVAAVRARYGLPERYALYLGSNKPHKNLVRLVEAWNRVAHNSQIVHGKLVIAGAWDERYPEAKERAAALGLGDQVMFLGPVAGADLPALYAAAELFVFPSLYEGFGLPVLEAMACGTPVICSNAPALVEVTSAPGPRAGMASPPGPLPMQGRREKEASAALLVDPLNVSEMAEALARLWTDPALRAELRQRGLAQAQRFNWQTTAHQTLMCYRALAQADH